MEYLKNKIDELKIWTCDKGDIVEFIWLSFYQWRQLKLLDAKYDPESVPDWYSILDCLAEKWKVDLTTNGGRLTYHRKLRELLKKSATKIVQEIMDSIHESSEQTTTA